jgi:hypothetical protein
LLNGQNGGPIEVVDPDTQRTYMLVTREQFEKVCSLLDDAASAPVSQLSLEIPPGIRRSQEAFWRDLPELLKQRKLRGRWVYYFGDERVGIAKRMTPLVQQCLARGIERKEFYVGYIEELPTPPWEPTVLEESLFEAVDHQPSAASTTS